VVFPLPPPAAQPFCPPPCRCPGLGHPQTWRRSASAGAPGGGFGDQAPPGVNQATWPKAQQACASLQPSQAARDNGAITAYRNCLADHGVTMNGGLGSLDQDDPKVAAALQACEPLRPSNVPTARPSS
jgi:hypothetical protein